MAINDSMPSGESRTPEYLVGYEGGQLVRVPVGSGQPNETNNLATINTAQVAAGASGVAAVKADGTLLDTLGAPITSGGGYIKPPTGIPLTDMAAAVQAAITAGATALQQATADVRYVRTVNGTAPDGSGNVVTAGGTVTAASITDASTAGRNLLTAATVAVQRTQLGLGTAAVADSSAFATAAQGAKADTALQAAPVTSVAGKLGAVSLVVGDVLGAQPTLTSGLTIKTVNGNSLLGAGDLTVAGGASTTQVPFSTTWDATASKIINAPYTVTGALAMVGTQTGSVPGGYTSGVFIANGTNIPTWNGTVATAWNNTNGARNTVTFTEEVEGIHYWFVNGSRLYCPASGNAVEEVAPATGGAGTTYSLTKSGDTLTLTPSTGTAQNVDLSGYVDATELTAALNTKTGAPAPVTAVTAYKTSNLSGDVLPNQSITTNLTLTNDDTGALTGGSMAGYYTNTGSASINLTTGDGKVTALAAGASALVVRWKHRADSVALWLVSGGAAPAAATAITLSGPATSTVGVASSVFTVGANGTITGSITVTPTPVTGLTFTPASVTLTAGAPTATFTATAASAGSRSVAVTNNASLTNPSSITLVSSEAAATAVTLTGPTTSTAGSASTAYTVGANGTITGTVVVTPTPVAGVTFTPTSVSISAGTPTATFTATVAAASTVSVAVTNNGGLTNPSAISLTASAAATVPGAPTGLTLGATGETTQALTWTAPASNGGSAITGYRVGYRTPQGSGAYTYVNTGSATAAYTLTGLTASTPYDIVVDAVNSIGPGADSTAVQVTTNAPAAFTPVGTSLRALFKDGGAIESTTSAPWLYTLPAATAYAHARFFSRTWLAAEKFIARIERIANATVSLNIPATGGGASNSLAFGYKPAGLYLGNADFTEILLENVTNTAPTAGAWSRGAQWANRAAHANTNLFAANDNGSRLAVYSSLDDGATWAELAVYTYTAAAAVGYASGVGALTLTTAHTTAVRVYFGVA